ncbi:hypothetical protein EVAR_50565_1 [Eumeta japonica]|uniref:Uncharacterized protein n=1 Tax=Eumeta variegata TaxID=151549 RepID=A0A4C1Z9X2_EUMVA|nr:hypothetical protein EVAR_50565_1 [Eumeta japonica]
MRVAREGRRSSPPMDTPNPREYTSALLISNATDETITSRLHSGTAIERLRRGRNVEIDHVRHKTKTEAVQVAIEYRKRLKKFKRTFPDEQQMPFDSSYHFKALQ